MPDRLYELIPNELLFDPAAMTTLLNAGKTGGFVRQTGLETLPETPGAGTHSFVLSRSVARTLLEGPAE